jgi:hypothetical protein
VVADDIQLTVSPNPVSGLTAQLGYSLKSASTVKIAVYNLAGETVATINEAKEAGDNTSDLDVSALSNGIYIISIAADGITTQTKMILNK